MAKYNLDLVIIGFFASVSVAFHIVNDRPYLVAKTYGQHLSGSGNTNAKCGLCFAIEDLNVCANKKAIVALGLINKVVSAQHNKFDYLLRKTCLSYRVGGKQFLLAEKVCCSYIREYKCWP